MFNSLAGWASTAADSVSQLANASVHEVSEAFATDATHEPLGQGQAPWSAVPASWADRPKAWQCLARRLGLDPRSFVLSASNVPVDDLPAGFPAAASAMDTALLQRALAVAEDADIANVRYRVVPRLVSEDVAWLNYFWRCDVLAQCTTTENAISVLQVLNAGGSEHLLADAVDAVRSAAADDLWSRDARERSQCIVDDCDRAASLLRGLLDRQEPWNLAASVAESCEYHKGQLAKFLAELEEHTKDVVDTPLQPGELAHETLLRMNEVLACELRRFAALDEPESVDAQTSANVATDPSSVEDTETVPATVETKFEAHLPWDDDEE